jgi:anti-sigma B factor antagonist
MTVEITVDGKTHLFTIAGDVDLKSSPRLREKLREAIKAGAKAILLDMSQCPYIDSSGIATLVEALQGLKGAGGKLAIAGASQRVKDIFEIAHLDGIFAIFERLEEAKASL